MPTLKKPTPQDNYLKTVGRVLSGDGHVDKDKAAKAGLQNQLLSLDAQESKLLERGDYIGEHYRVYSGGYPENRL